ncbi:CIC11C00000004788 [Sungouiella intermedia]|uniref:serine--tRNA ligase n=1 Tax=Sungouiella intermedia TaxID=45354 RepID=A0A1L0BES5_9ASCO|nr:CIC11C00000004788 [[Candida] intermedia]
MLRRQFRRYASTFRSTTALKRPVFDIKAILARSEEMRTSMERRGERDTSRLDFILENRQKEIDLQNERNRLVNERKSLGSQMAGLVKQGDLEEKADLQNKLLDFKTRISAVEADLDALSEKIHNAVESLPNWLDCSVPQDPLEPEVVQVIGGTSLMEIESSMPVNQNDHKKIGEALGLMEFAAASRISGSSWYYLVGDGALLEQALVQYALRRARQNGYRMVVPPSIVKSEVVNACGFKPKDQNNEKQVYEIEGEDLSLTGTAEIPLGALHSSSTIDLPRKYVGVSRSYRAEAGARGKDTTGLYRVHEFTKVELFHFTDSSRSEKELEELRLFQTSIIEDLGLGAKMLNMPTTDLGAPAMKKYDCEAWMPGRGSWGELTSCSNCGDYQARRLGIRHKNSAGKLDYVHTLNGTAMAVPRVIVAIIEQNYDPQTKSVKIPSPLVPYMDGKTHIT